MQHLVLCAAFLSAATAYIAPSYAGTGALLKEPTGVPELSTTAQRDAVTSNNANAAATSTASPSASAAASASPPPDTNLVQEIVSELPITLPSILEELDGPKRRVITYDQRQEGQYNIRADLDNFMIVLIPPSPSEGLSLLDILTKSSLRKTSHSSNKNKKKHYSSSLAMQPESGLKFRHPLKSPEYFPRQPEQSDVATSRVGEFMEGRTPYHVDISAVHDGGEGVQARLNPDRQVDVLPPPYPLAYQHLIKPYLEAESSIIQTLPPADLAGHQSSESSQNTGFYRFARYIRGDNFLDTNRVTTSNRLGSQGQATARRISQIPIYRSDLSMGASQLYPPLDVPHFNLPSTARSFDDKSFTSTEDVEGKQTLDGGDLPYEDVFVPSIHIRPLEDDLELDLHTDSLIDGEAKALLSDGIERCAPGKRRDSYGVCREIEGY